jgi:hypothetical protein
MEVGDGRAQPGHRLRIKDIVTIDPDLAGKYGIKPFHVNGAVANARKLLSEAKLLGTNETVRQLVRGKLAQYMPGVQFCKELNLEADFLGNNTGNMNADKVSEFMQGNPANRGWCKELAAEIWSEQDGILCDILAEGFRIKQELEVKKASENPLHKTLLETSASHSIHRAHALILDHWGFVARGRKAATGSGEASTHYGSQP